MLYTYSTDPDIIDNDGKRISFRIWGMLENIMAYDDYRAFNVMNDNKPSSAQFLFDVYSKEYEKDNGKNWKPKISESERN